MDPKYLHSLKKLAVNLTVIPSDLDPVGAFDYTNFPLTASQALYIMSIKDEKLVYQRNILKLLGYHEKEFRFDNIFGMMHKDDKTIVETIVKNTLTFSQKQGISDRAALYLTYRMRRKDGNYIKVQRISGVYNIPESEGLAWNYSILQDISYMGLSSEVRFEWNSPIVNRAAYEKYVRVMPQDLFTKREMQIYRLMTTGMKGIDIATKLKISINTVKSHKHRMTQKAGIASSSNLVDYFENQAYRSRPWE